MTQTATLKTAVSPAKSPASPPAQTYDELFERGDYYTVVNGVLPLVGSGPTGLHAAMLACKSYVALGLIDAAREIITHPTSPLSQMHEFQSLLPRLTEIPGSKISWATLTDRFEKNLSTLLSRHPHLAVHESTFRGIPDWLELHRCRDGNLQVMQRDDAAQGRWLPGLLDLRRLSAEIAIPNEGKQLTCPPYLITGDHFGCLFKRVFDSSNRLFLTYSPWIYLIEPDPASLGLCLYTEESVDKWCHDRVIIHAGPRCVEDFAATCRANLEQCLPDSCLHTPFAHRPVLDDLIAAIHSINREQGEALKDSRKAAHSHYDSVPANYWASRYDPSDCDGVQKPLRVLGITSRFTTVLQYSMRDLKAAFQRAGHTFDLLIEPTDADQHTQLAMARAVEKSRPDLIFLIDHHRHEYGSLFPQSVPYVCWIQDMLPNITTSSAADRMGPRDFFIAADPAELTRSYNYPADRGMCWTLATNHRLFSSEPLPESELAPYRCDFSFVSNQSMTPAAFHQAYSGRHGIPAANRRVLDYLFQRVQKINVETPEKAGGLVAGSLIADMERDLGVAPTSIEHRNNICRTYIHPLSELFFRQTTLEWIADFCDRTGKSLSLYGNGWESHPRFARYTRGAIQNGTALRALYQASAISLQIIGSGAIHQRLLDGLAAGGFFLIRGTPIDTIQHACRRLVEFFEQGRLKTGSPIAASDAELCAVLEDLRPLLGARDHKSPLVLGNDELNMVQSALASRDRRFASAVFPTEYPKVVFSSRNEFEASADRYLSDAGCRHSIAASMRTVVESSFTYDALVSDIGTFLGNHFATLRA
ncbi:MAG: hypothetical protein HS101_02265 [Planctomycetia bacterium]|nr:hypothetical protein [Planctomycetia bacterium]